MICVSIADVSIEDAKKIINENELSEVRLDRLKAGDDEIKTMFSSTNKTIATYRPVDGIDEETRKKALILAIESGASYVDVEVEADDGYKAGIIAAARRNKCLVIVSYHDFTKTPVMRELEQVLNWCYESGADIAKIACRVSSAEDNARLLSVYSMNKNVISIGMGEPGRITRIAATLLGAPFTYASIDRERKTAPGQIDSVSLKNIIRMISEA